MLRLTSTLTKKIVKAINEAQPDLKGTYKEFSVFDGNVLESGDESLDLFCTTPVSEAYKDEWSIGNKCHLEVRCYVPNNARDVRNKWGLYAEELICIVTIEHDNGNVEFLKREL